MPVTEGDFFRQPLREQINPKHPLVGLADLISWERLGASLSESFVRTTVIRWLKRWNRQQSCATPRRKSPSLTAATRASPSTA